MSDSDKIKNMKEFAGLKKKPLLTLAKLRYSANEEDEVYEEWFDLFCTCGVRYVETKKVSYLKHCHKLLGLDIN